MLRQDVIDFELNQDCDRVTSGKLLVRFPVPLGVELNPENKWLDLFTGEQFDASDTEDYLYLQLFPSYTQENDVLGEGGLKNTFNSAAVFAPSTTRRGFKARITDRRLLIFNLIQRLAYYSRASSYLTYAPVKVVDYCLPEPGEEYSIRYGAIDLGSLSGLRKGNFREDWEFTFKEARLREY